MKAMKVKFDKEKDTIDIIDDGTEEDWIKVCEDFDNDVHRIRDVEGHSPYNALYACYNEDNKPSCYIVEEDRQLDKVRHKVFLKKLGRTD
jgi:hypothetical protein